jgi:hypothetical protein
MRSLATIRFSLFLALASSLLMIAPYAGAKPNPAPAPMVQSKVTGHLYLEGMAVKQIVIDRQSDKSYLYLQRADSNVFVIADVTDPAKPKFLERITLPEAADSIVNLPAIDSDFAMAFAPESGSAAVSSSPDPSSLPTQSVRLLDVTDPRHPIILTTFDGVTSTATDEGRKLVFLANSQGLWVVSYQRTRPLPPCTSSDALTALPACQ